MSMSYEASYANPAYFTATRPRSCDLVALCRCKACIFVFRGSFGVCLTAWGTRKIAEQHLRLLLRRQLGREQGCNLSRQLAQLCQGPLRQPISTSLGEALVELQAALHQSQGLRRRLAERIEVGVADQLGRQGPLACRP